MGRTASSSRRKSSKKKKTSEAHRSKRSKRSKRNNKSKKLHVDDSSSYSDDDSASSMSVLSSSSEDDYKSRRGRSRKKTDVKSSKTRARERSKDAVRVKKNKRKHRDSKATKKRKYKKSRRDTSVSSTSTDSFSSSSTSGESEFERRRGRAREKRNNKGDLGKPRRGDRKRKTRSLSCSSVSRFSDDDTEEKTAVEVSSRRLRSVITVASRADGRDESEGKKDEIHTDEIVYEHDDDYPSRSNDSNDGVNKRDGVHQSSANSNKRATVENEDLDSKLSMASPKKERESGVSVTTVDASSSNGQDLELILRQKALENLKRFRGVGGSQTSEKPHSCEYAQSNLPKQDDFDSVEAAKIPLPTLTKDSPRQKEGNILDGKESLSRRVERNRGIKPGSAQSESSLSNLGQESIGASLILKPAPTSLTSPNLNLVMNKKSSGMNKGGGETSESKGEIKDGIGVDDYSTNIPLTSPNVNSVTNKNSVVNKDRGEISENEGGIKDGGGSSRTELESMVGPSSEEVHDGQEQVKDSSQFQQKTMSVMRGGEMVQVSYKVYIPKKVPALARRKLQR